MPGVRNIVLFHYNPCGANERLNLQIHQHEKNKKFESHFNCQTKHIAIFIEQLLQDVTTRDHNKENIRQLSDEYYSL